MGDFEIDIEKMTDAVTTYDGMVNDLNQYLSDFLDNIQELLDNGWKGKSKLQYGNKVDKLGTDCLNFIEDLTTYKQIINSNLPELEKLLEKGMNLKI